MLSADYLQDFNVGKKYLLVSEGPTDFVILKHIAGKISASSGKDIIIIEMSPARDATSGTYPPHGWGGVKRWCKKYSRNKNPQELNKLAPMARQMLQRLNWPALIALNKADGIIIQMDTDIAHLLNDPIVYKVGSSRRAHCESSIVLWLNEKTKPDEIYLVISSCAIETWILSTHDPAESIFSDLSKGFDYEEISDVETRLVALGYASYNDRGTRRLKKSPSSTYEAHGTLVADKLDVVRTRCAEVEAFCTHLEV